jgi:hypothetical protein
MDFGIHSRLERAATDDQEMNVRAGRPDVTAYPDELLGGFLWDKSGDAADEGCALREAKANPQIGGFNGTGAQLDSVRNDG